MASYISLTNLIYPVGAYYMSDSSTSPASLFGGAWSALTGRFLYCNNGTGTGGSNTHTLTTSEMPSHNHTVGFDLDVSYSSGSTRYSPHSAGASSAGYRFNSSWTGGVCSQQYASISDVLLLEENLLTSAGVRRNG